MKITGMEIWPITIPYKKPYTTALGTAPSGTHVILKLFTDQGIVGLGEAAIIIPDRTGETQGNIVEVLRDLFSSFILGKDPFDMEGIMESLDGLASGRYAFPYSKCAVDNALYDIMGKALGVPVYKLIGGAFRKQIGVSRSLPLKSPSEVVAEAEERRAMGYKMLTLKGCSDWRGDIQRFIAVRKAVGEDYPLELDPNQAYSVRDAIRVIRELEPYRLENVEQPCAWWDLDGMAEVKRSVSVPIAADESVLTPVEAMEVVKKRAADMITIKLAKMGGIYYARKVVAIAEAAGLSCNMGSKHTFGVGTAAIIHFSAATKTVIEPIGYGSPLERFVDDIITEPIPFQKGVVSLLEGPGLGVTLDESKLRKYAAGEPSVVKK